LVDAHADSMDVSGPLSHAAGWRLTVRFPARRVETVGGGLPSPSGGR
jgi:hypothetical protein